MEIKTDSIQRAGILQSDQSYESIVYLYCISIVFSNCVNRETHLLAI